MDTIFVHISGKKKGDTNSMIFDRDFCIPYMK